MAVGKARPAVHHREPAEAPPPISPPRRWCAPADGYTLFLLGSSGAVSATLYNKLNFNLIRDIVPVASISRAPSVLEANPPAPTKTVPKFIAYAKANPGNLNVAELALMPSASCSR